MRILQIEAQRHAIPCTLLSNVCVRQQKNITLNTWESSCQYWIFKHKGVHLCEHYTLKRRGVPQYEYCTFKTKVILKCEQSTAEYWVCSNVNIPLSSNGSHQKAEEHIPIRKLYSQKKRYAQLCILHKMLVCFGSAVCPSGCITRILLKTGSH